MTEEMLMATSKAKLAELVAREIYEIRESKNNLLRGESDYMPSDGEGLKLMIDNLQKQEDALLKLFTGSTSREISSRTFSIVPEENTIKQVAARFSRKLGFDGYNVALAALEAAGSVDPNAIAEALPSLVYEDAVTGSISFDDVGDAKKDMAYVKKVNNETGAFDFVKTQSVAGL